MKKSERDAKQKLKAHGIVTTKKGSVAGNVKDPAGWETAPTTTLKHGPISRLLRNPPQEKKR